MNEAMNAIADKVEFLIEKKVERIKGKLINELREGLFTDQIKCLLQHYLESIHARLTSHENLLNLLMEDFQAFKHSFTLPPTAHQSTGLVSCAGKQLRTKHSFSHSLSLHSDLEIQKCCICNEFTEGQELLQLHCGHSTHRKCLQAKATHQIEQLGFATANCVGKANGRICYSKIQLNYLELPNFTQLLNRQLQNQLRKLQLRHSPCPSVKCEYFFQPVPGKGSILVCPLCGIRFCLGCKAPVDSDHVRCSREVPSRLIGKICDKCGLYNESQKWGIGVDCKGCNNFLMF